MAHVLKVTDGTNTVTLTSGDMYLAEYEPAVAMDVFSPIKERAKVGFTSSEATIQSNVRALNRLLWQAQSYARNKTGSRVYVNFDPGTSGTEWRALLYGGAVHPGPELLGSEWAGNAVELDVEWTRDPYWEGALTQLSLTNVHGTSSTGLQVDNADDANLDNWVSISSSDLVGDLPAPIKVMMTNTSTDATYGQEIYIFHNVYSAPSSFVHIVEAESSTDSHITSTTDAACSAGAYAAIAWDSTGLTQIGEWLLPTTDLSDAAGGRFALLARWRGNFPYADCWVQAKLETYPRGADIWVGNLSLVSATTDGSELTLLDTVRLPPYLEGQTNLRDLTLNLYARRDSTDSDIALDFIQLSPISGDSGWLRFVSVSTGIANSRIFVYDGTEGLVYWTITAEKTADYTQYGGPILLTPNVTQRLYFLSTNGGSQARPAATWDVRVWYRPRRFIL